MKSLCPFLAAFFVVTASGPCFAQEDQPFPRSGAEGFVFCPDPAKYPPVPVYASYCRRLQVGTLNCGEKVEVLSRHVEMFRISSSEGRPRFVSASAISQQPDKFVPFNNQSGIPDRGAPDCAQLLARENAPEGFVFCSGGQESAPVYFNPCHSSPSGSVACQEKVRVLARRGDMLQVTAPPHDLSRYIASSAVSQQADKFVLFGDDSGVPDKGAPDCSRPGSTFGVGGRLSQGGPPDRNVTPPRAIYNPPPPFSEEARRKKIQGVVTLSLTVAVDGTVHDVKVVKGLGYGLDEKAVETVSGWKFKPALKDGEPIENEISVEVNFHLY